MAQLLEHHTFDLIDWSSITNACVTNDIPEKDDVLPFITLLSRNGYQLFQESFQRQTDFWLVKTTCLLIVKEIGL